MKQLKNKILLIVGITIVSSFTAFAQFEPGPFNRFQKGRERIEAQKIAYITKQLSLTPDEAKLFWTVYDEYQDKKEAEQKAYREKYILQWADINKLTDKEAKELADSFVIHEQKMLDLNKEYNLKFQKVLPIRKVVMLYKAERNFRRILLKKIREYRKSNKKFRR